VPRVLSVVDSLCSVVPDRRPGSAGNSEAVSLVARLLGDAGWDVSLPEFDRLEWMGGEAFVEVGEAEIRVAPSPYGLGVDAVGPIRVVTRSDDLDRPELRVVVLTDPTI
jgi:Iap family predicted aminopeptidase